MSEKSAQCLEVIVVKDGAEAAQLLGHVVSAVDFGGVAVEVRDDGPEVGEHARLLLVALLDLVSLA